MPKFLVNISYSTEGLRGLRKDMASGREKAIAELCASAGGKLDALWFTVGEDHAIAIVDAPNLQTLAAVTVRVGAGGGATIRTVPLLTVAEMDAALTSDPAYRPPGG